MALCYPPIAKYILRTKVEPVAYTRVGCDAPSTVRVLMKHRVKGKKIGGSTLDAIMRMITGFLGASYCPEKCNLRWMKRHLKHYLPPRPSPPYACCEDTVECVHCFGLMCFGYFYSAVCMDLEHRPYDAARPPICCCLLITAAPMVVMCM